MPSLFELSAFEPIDQSSSSIRIAPTARSDSCHETRGLEKGVLVTARACLREIEKKGFNRGCSRSLHPRCCIAS